MKNNLGVLAFVLGALLMVFSCPICAGGNISHAKTAELKVKSVKINGYVGGRIDDCILHRVMGQDVDELCGAFPSQERDMAMAKRILGKMDLGSA